MAGWTIEWNNQAIKNNPSFEVGEITVFKISDTIHNVDELSMANVIISDGTTSMVINCIGVEDAADGVTGLIFAYPSYQFLVVVVLVSENSSDYESGLYVGDVFADTSLDITVSYVPVNFCLYNGVKLPDVNTAYCKENYPCAFIVTETADNITTAWLYLTANPVQIAPGLSGLKIPAGGYAQYICYTGSAVNNNPYAGYNYWKVSILTGDNATSFDAPKDGETAWSNHDVYNTDGTLYLAASDPVPVGGGSFTIDQASFLAGYKAGAELRRLRVSGGKTIITYTMGDYYGRPCVDMGSYKYIKISDLTPMPEEINGGKITASLFADGESLIEVYDIGLEKNANGCYCASVEAQVWVCLDKDGGTLLSYPENGIYVLDYTTNTTEDIPDDFECLVTIEW